MCFCWKRRTARRIGVVVDAGRVLALAGAQQPLAGQAPLDRRHRRLLGGAPREQLHLRRQRRLLLGQLLQRRDAAPCARAFSSSSRTLRQLLLVLLEVGGRDVGDGLDRLERLDALLVVAGVLLVLDEARAQHRQRRGDAVELQVVLVARLQRLAVLVELVVGQPEEDAAVAVGQRLPVRRRLLGEDERRPVVAQIDQRVARRLRRPRRRSSAPRDGRAGPITSSARCSGGRSGRGFSASSSDTCARGAPVRARGAAPGRGRRRGRGRARIA